MSYKERTFCDANDELRGLVNDTISAIENCLTYQDLSGLDVALEDLEKISELTNETQDYADSMENRLKKYKSCIESLGFERV